MLRGLQGLLLHSAHRRTTLDARSLLHQRRTWTGTQLSANTLFLYMIDLLYTWHIYREGVYNLYTLYILDVYKAYTEHINGIYSLNLYVHGIYMIYT